MDGEHVGVFKGFLRRVSRGTMLQNDMPKPNPNLSESELAAIAKDLRVWCIKMITKAASGHPGGSLSLA